MAMKILLVYGQQNLNTYIPKTYAGIPAANNQTLYPGDSIITYVYNSINAINSTTGQDNSLCVMKATRFDERYFHCEQIEVKKEYSKQYSQIQYTIGRKYTVKNTTEPLSTGVDMYLMGGNNNGTPQAFHFNDTANILNHLQSAQLSINPLANASFSFPLYPKPTGKIFATSDDFKKAILFPGDIIEITLDTSAYPHLSLAAFEDVVISYPDLFDMHDVPNSGDLSVYQTPIWIVRSKRHYILKNTFTKECACTFFKMAFYIGPWAQGHNIGWNKVTQCETVTLKPFPNFFSYAENDLSLQQVLRYFLSTTQGCTSSAQDEDKRTPLMWSIYYENKELVKYFLTDPLLELRIQDKQGKTALMYAVEKNNQEIIDLITKHSSVGFCLPVVDTHGMTALHYAVWNNNEATVRKILNIKSSQSIINIQNEKRLTALMYAAVRASSSITHLLLDNKADPFLQDAYGFNMLWYAAMSLQNAYLQYVYTLLISNNKEKVSNALNNSAIDGTNIIYNTLLMGKTDSDFYDIIQFLIQQGVSVNCTYVPSRKVSVSILGTEIDNERKLYPTPLALACSKGKNAQQTINLLLKAYAIVDKDVIQIAEKNNVDDLIRTYSTTVGPNVYSSLYYGKTQKALALVAQFTPETPYAHTISNYSNSGWSLLFLLSTQAHKNNVDEYNKIAEQLITCGANVNVIGPDAQGNPVTPLVWAMQEGNTRLQSLLESAKSTKTQYISNEITSVVAPQGLLSSQPSQTQVTNAENLVDGMTLYNSTEELLG